MPAWCCISTSGWGSGCSRAVTSTTARSRGRRRGARPSEETGLPVVPDGDPIPARPCRRPSRARVATPISTSATTSLRRPVEPTPPEGESPDARWFTWAEAIAIAEPGLEGALRAAQPGRPTIRPAVVDRCTAVRTGSTRRSKAFAIPEVPEPHTEAEIATWMGDVAIPTMDVWVADVDGVVVGQMMLSRTGRTGCITSTSIRRGWAGDSATSSWRSLANVIPTACSCGRSRATRRRRRFYERHGFVAVEFTDGSGNEERWPDVRYTGEAYRRSNDASDGGWNM